MQHLYLTIIAPSIIAFAGTLIAVQFIRSYFPSSGIVAEDRNKKERKILPGSGGVAVAFGIIIGILAYTFGASFIYKPILNIPILLATALSIMLITFVGFLDDINIKKTQVKTTGMMDIREGLKQWQKPILTLLGALPLIAINAGVSTIQIPIIGTINLWIFYPIVIIPLAVIFVSNASNLLGGFNGLEAGMGIIVGIGLLIYSLFYGNGIGILISAMLVTTLFAFLIFNWYPAKILPGDSLTYGIGGAIAAIMIMGNAEIFGIIIFIPWIVEFLLHAKGKFKVTDLGIRQKDGTLKAPYGEKIYSLTHIIMNIKKMKEREVTIYLMVIEVVFVVIALFLKLHGII